MNSIVMKKILLVVFVACLFTAAGGAQNLVGMSSGDITSYLKDKKGINPDSLMLNKNSNGTSYISYQTAEKKIVYFLDSSNTCYTYRVIYPYNQLNSVLKKLDEQFVPQGRFKWLVYGRQTFVITLEPNEDFFVTDMSLQ